AVVTAVAIALQIWLGLESALAGLSVAANIGAVTLAAVVGHRAAANTEDARVARERQLSILLDTANRLNAATDLQAVLEHVADAARRFVAHGGEQIAATELELLGGLAQVAGLAIARTRQVELERRRFQVLQVLNEAMLAAGSAANTEEVSTLVAEKARALAGGEAGALVLRHAQRG